MSFFFKKKNDKAKQTVVSSEPIVIDTALLRSAVTQIRSSNTNMYDEAKSILQTVNDLDGDWDSDVYKDFKTRVKKTEDVYMQYYALLDGVANLMEGIAEAYENLEKSLTNAAGGKK